MFRTPLYAINALFVFTLLFTAGGALAQAQEEGEEEPLNPPATTRTQTKDALDREW